MTHDIFMTDDNIMIPFFISIPGFQKNIKFSTQISTINIFPTLLDYLNIKLPNTNINYASSLIPIIKKENEIFIIEPYARCDARFLGQSDRVCCIRNKHYKLIYNYEEKKFQYNKIEGLKEKEIKKIDKNFNLEKIFKGHFKFLNETDNLALEMFKKKYTKKLIKEFKKIPKNKVINIYLYSNAIELFNNSIINLIKDDLQKTREISLSFKSFDYKDKFFKSNKILKKEFKNNYDLKILLQTDNADLGDLLNNFKEIKSKNSLIIPTSLTGEILQGRIKRAFKTIWNSRILYIYEPFLIIKLFLKLIKN